MASEQPEALRLANLERSERQRTLVIDTLRKFEEEGWPITKTAISEKSGASLWLIHRPEMSSMIEDAIMRQSMRYSNSNQNEAMPSLASLKAQLVNTLEQNRKLNERNARLKEALNTKLGSDLETRARLHQIEAGVPDELVLQENREIAALKELILYLQGELVERVEEVQALRSRLARPKLVSLPTSSDENRE